MSSNTIHEANQNNIKIPNKFLRSTDPIMKHEHKMIIFLHLRDPVVINYAIKSSQSIYWRSLYNTL